MAQDKQFAVFILSHGRPDNVVTYQKLRSHGYTGKIYVIVDDEDKTIDRYRERFGDQVIVFSKEKYKSRFDVMDNFDGNKVIVYARNACYDIARDLGLAYFFEYEDDYKSFEHRYIEGKKLKVKKIKSLDAIMESVLICLNQTGATTIAFAQGGDFVGGVKSFNRNSLKRKAMNSFAFKVHKNKEDDVLFIGRMNDDVNTYLTQGKIGKLFFQITTPSLTQAQTQSKAGGNTEAYKLYGTYVKSFYSVMAAPDCCRIDMMGSSNMRIHHKINWENAVPKIINEKFKKRK